MYCVLITEESENKQCQPLIFQTIEDAILGSFQFMKEIIPPLTLDTYKKNMVSKTKLLYVIKLIIGSQTFKIDIVEGRDCTKTNL